jgi:riboflavin biosynthesis pyrimidine reductase
VSSPPRLIDAPISSIDLAVSYPWPAKGRWVRAMMALTLDGAVAGADGRSGSISSPTDRAVLAEVRRLSDVVLIGAGTLRAERYGPMRARAADATERQALGLAPAPVLAVVSGSLDLPWQEPVFAESSQRPIVVTSSAADPVLLAAAREHADLVVLEGSTIDPIALIRTLEQRGLSRVVCEGGPSLLASLSRCALIDEADISFSPLLTAGGQVSTGSPLAEPMRMALAHAIGDDGFLFTRYLAERPGGGSERSA